MRTTFVFLAILNFTLFLLAAAGKVAESYAPRLYDTPWARVIAVYGIGWALTWPWFLLAGIVQGLVSTIPTPAAPGAM